MNLDDEVFRLLRLHPAIRQGVEPDYHEVYWQPQHAVPKYQRARPFHSAAIDLQVAQDLARIDAEIDPQGSTNTSGPTLTDWKSLIENLYSAQPSTAAGPPKPKRGDKPWRAKQSRKAKRR